MSDKCVCVKCVVCQEKEIRKEAKDLKEIYPEFDLDYCCKSYYFLDLISRGCSLNLIYPNFKDEIDRDIRLIKQRKIEELKSELEVLENE